MITFKINDEKELFKFFLDLNDMVRAGDYNKAVMLGPYNDYCMVKSGIIIDGLGEKQLANDFEELLKKDEVVYKRVNQYGVLWYEERSF